MMPVSRPRAANASLDELSPVTSPAAIGSWIEERNKGMNAIEQSQQLLSVAAHHSLTDLKKAYLKLAKQYHPDKFQDNPKQQREATQIFQQITAAYNTLKSDPTGVREGQSRTSEPKYPQTISRKSSPEFFYEQASLLAVLYEYSQAVNALNQALKINPRYAQAYEFRGHLKSLLGFEIQAASDWAKAENLRRGRNVPQETADTPYTQNVGWTATVQTTTEVQVSTTTQPIPQQGLWVHSQYRKSIFILMGIIITLILGYGVAQPDRSPGRTDNMNPVSPLSNSH